MNLNNKKKIKNQLIASISENWKETTLGEVSEVQTGKNIPTSQQLSKGKYEIIGANGLIGYTDNFLLDGEYILTGRVGTIGKINYKKGKFYPSDNVIFIKSNKDNSNKFLFYLLKIKQLKSLNVGSTQPLIKQSDIKNFPILLPPLPEQQAIAQVLSSFDDKIELLREENKTLEELGQTIFKEWFGKYSIDDKLPEGWRVGKIIEIIKREPVSYKCDKKDLDPKGGTPIIDQGSNGLYGYTSRNPDFIATKENPVIIFTNHTCNYWFIDYPFCAIQNILPYRGKDGYDEYFLYFMTKGSITFIEYKGHWPDFEAKDFIISPVEIAQKFSKIAKPILQKISDNNLQIKSLSRTRDELLLRLMSGEIRVKI